MAFEQRENRVPAHREARDDCAVDAELGERVGDRVGLELDRRDVGHLEAQRDVMTRWRRPHAGEVEREDGERAREQRHDVVPHA